MEKNEKKMMKMMPMVFLSLEGWIGGNFFYFNCFLSLSLSLSLSRPPDRQLVAADGGLLQGLAGGAASKQ